MDANRRLKDDDEDLLNPTLTAHDDAVGFDRPWNPNYLVLLGAFFGFIPMGLLLAENFKRLGRPGAFGPVLGATVVAGIAITAFSSYANLYGLPGYFEAGNLEHRRALRLAHQGLAIVVGLAIAHRQRPRWEIHTRHGGEPGPFFKYALGAILVGVGLQMLVGLAFVSVYAGPAAP